MAGDRIIRRLQDVTFVILVTMSTTRSVEAAPTNLPFVLLHIGPVVGKNPCAAAPTTCADVVTAASADPTGQTGYFVYAACRNTTAAPGNNIAGVQFGIDYESPGAGEGLVISDWHLCASLQFPMSNWPQPNSGNIVTWDSVGHCQADELAIAGYFYVTPYTPATLRLIPRPVDGEILVADCSGLATSIYPAYRGHVSFGGATWLDHAGGHNPCLDGDSGWNLPPVTTITQGPAEGEEISSYSVEFHWSATDDRGDHCRFSFRLDSNSWSSFSISPLTFVHVTPGDHTFQVKARDDLGLEEPTPATRHFRVFDPTPIEFADLRTEAIDGRLLLSWRFDTDEAVTFEVWRSPWFTDEWRRQAAALRPDENGNAAWSDESAPPETEYGYRIVAIGRSRRLESGPIRATTPAGRLAVHLTSGTPIRGSGDIEFELPRAADANLSLFDVSGRHLRTLWSGVLAGGRHHVTWNGRDGDDRLLASGAYWLLLRSETGRASARIIVAR